MLLAKNKIVITVIIMDLLSGMELDLLVPSFPELKNYFHLSAFWVEALLAINFIGYCVGLLFVGSLADRYGRKPIILLGLSTFLLGSLLCWWGIAYDLLFLGRFLQGIGIAAPAILSFLIIADVYSVKKQQFLLAMLNGAMNIAVAAAPVIGSYVTLYFQWRGNFMLLLLMGLVALVMTTIFIPTYPLPKQRETLSLRGYLPLWQSKDLRLLIIHIVLMITPYWIFVGLSPLLYMQDLGVSLAHFGYYQGTLAFVFALGSLLFGAMMHRYTIKKSLQIANQIFLLSLVSVLMATFLANTHPLLITLSFIPFAIGEIAPSAILYPLALDYLPSAKGRIAALIQGLRLLVSALSVQLASYFYAGSFRSIGLIITVFTLFVIITLYQILHRRHLLPLAT